MRLITSNNEYIDFDIEGYEFEEYVPLEEDYDYDAQWLITKFLYKNNNDEIEISGAYLMTFELQELINDLSRLYNNKTRKIETYFTEEYIKIECYKKDNHFNLIVRIKDYLTNNKYKVISEIKEEELDELITNLEILYLKYPERV